MSVLNKIKEITDDIQKLAKENPKVTVTSDSAVVVENHKSVKLLTDEALLIETNEFFIYICGTDIVVRFFSPSRLVVEGKIKTISYLKDGIGISEDL